MEGCWRCVRFALPRVNSISRRLLAVLLLYSFTSQFLPIEPYLVPYLTAVKNFSNYEITVDIFPISVYSQLLCTLLMVPACCYLSHKVVIILGTFAVLLTYLIVWFGTSLLAMRLMQIAYGFGMSTRLVYSAYVFLLVHEEEYQSMTSLTTTISLLSFLLASELGQCLYLQRTSYEIFFVLTIISLGICCIMSVMLPKDHLQSPKSSFIDFSAEKQEGWISLLKATWNHKTLRILSIWWAVAYAGFSLIQNYGTNLFDAIDSKSKFNGHILAASQAAGSFGAHYAVYIETLASKSGLKMYVLGMVLIGILCLCMGLFRNIWSGYLTYVAICGIYQTLACLVTARCGRLLSNGQFILLFSVNTFGGLLFETLLQAVVEISKLSVFAQFIWFSGFFLLSAIVFIGFDFIGARKSKSATVLLPEAEDEELMSAIAQ
ncbi:hypothetical protein HPP92_013912 [Vanilla planifolia]|uniref:Uncharacterized protein n=1 Tax=Vanilla planifolia TaxID=51239 RepID=A0A835UZ29_VANPL|nr:hypothetical protein HPP92_013912 [Vanilla planifolia]